MRGGLRIPGVVDVLRVDTPEAILTLVEDVRLDRRFEGTGPLLNRFIARRIRRVLHVDGVPLPPVSARDTPGRAENQAELEAALTLAPERLPSDEAHLNALTEHVLGWRTDANLAPLVQEVVGRLFAADYQATRQTWKAARTLDLAARSFNPFRQLWWLVTGAVPRARRLLADKVGSNLAAVHATGIAVHNLVTSLERMQELAASPGALQRLSPQAAVARCLAAPSNVLREARAGGTTTAGSFRPGSLAVLRLETARACTIRRDIAFLTCTWSRCPAHLWVPALLQAVWARAGAMNTESSHE